MLDISKVEVLQPSTIDNNHLTTIILAVLLQLMIQSCSTSASASRLTPPSTLEFIMLQHGRQSRRRDRARRHTTDVQDVRRTLRYCAAHVVPVSGILEPVHQYSRFLQTSCPGVDCQFVKEKLRNMIMCKHGLSGMIISFILKFKILRGGMKTQIFNKQILDNYSSEEKIFEDSIL